MEELIRVKGGGILAARPHHSPASVPGEQQAAADPPGTLTPSLPLWRRIHYTFPPNQKAKIVNCNRPFPEFYISVPLPILLNVSKLKL